MKSIQLLLTLLSLTVSIAGLPNPNADPSMSIDCGEPPPPPDQTCWTELGEVCPPSSEALLPRSPVATAMPNLDNQAITGSFKTSTTNVKPSKSITGGSASNSKPTTANKRSTLNWKPVPTHYQATVTQAAGVRR
ncbi:hypothetical protein BDV95DRAFT_607816 [Massariosphaeria phaeospora]|uniref:CBM1 domain-containing protein n=1 Tax=Massariosphaeria phaeospora TaxID=100035 RepID=A0A7C8I8A3_9PLEO|nr:hypothetical protein BDV95DRAFT_607816 [Massariosphaeria phaeospora]